jgi:drug/metabolite transporter (DMT)-like permease
MSPIKQFLLTLALTAMWSPSFLFIKLALPDFQPFALVAFRVSIAVLIFGGLLCWHRRALPKAKTFWLRTTIMAVFSSCLPFYLFCYAEKTIDSALAAIINGSTPMFTALLAHMFVASDRMHSQKALGIALSAFGMLLLFTPNLQQGVSGSLLGMLAATGASFSYAVSHIYGKLYTTGQQPFVAPTAQFIVSSIMLWPLAFWHGDVSGLSLPSFSGIMGVCGLALFGTVFAFIIYYKLLDHCGPTAISMVTCFFPVVGMFLGFIFLEEKVTWVGLVAAGLILLGMLTVNEVISFKFLKPKQVSTS